MPNHCLPFKELVHLVYLSVVCHLKQVSDENSTQTVGITSAFVDFGILILVFSEYISHSFLFEFFLNVVLDLVKSSVDEIRW